MTLTRSLSHVPGLVYALVYQPLPSIVTSRSATSGGNPLSLNSPDSTSSGSQVIPFQTIQWSNFSDDDLINGAVREIWQQADELAQQMGMMRRWRYLNYAAEGSGSVGELWGGEFEEFEAD